MSYISARTTERADFVKYFFFFLIVPATKYLTYSKNQELCNLLCALSGNAAASTHTRAVAEDFLKTS